MPLKDYLQTRGTMTMQQPTFNVGSLSNFLKKTSITIPKINTEQAQSTPAFVQPKKTSKIKDTFRYIGKQLMKPSGIVAKELRGIGESIGDLISIASPRVSASEGIKKAAQSILKAQKGAFNVLAGTEETTLTKEMEDAGKMTALDKTMAIGGEFILDPLWVIKPVKIAAKVGQITRLAKPAKALADLIKEAPAAKKLITLFSNTTGNPEFDAVVKKFRNLKDYREANLIDDAVKLQRDIKTLGKGAEEIITEGLENPASLYKTTEKVIPQVSKSLLAKEARKVEKVGQELLNNAKKTIENFDEKMVIKIANNIADFNKDKIIKGQYVTEALQFYKQTPEEIIKLGLQSKFYKETGINALEQRAKEIGIIKGVKEVAEVKPIVDEKIINIVENLRNTYKTLLEQSKKVGLKIGEIQDYAPHIRTKESFLKTLKENFGLGAREFGKGAVEKGRKLEGTIKELTEKGIDIFEKNPAIQLAKKGQMYAKAITSQEFAGAVKKFAVEKGTEVTHPALKGLKFAQEQAAVIDNYYQSIRPEELKIIVKTFDKVQNWWKAQALISPSYHIRNIAGNLWNNFIAGVNPIYYFKAGALQKGELKSAGLIEKMKKLGVINKGWYSKDIGEEVIARVEGVKNWKVGLNPLSQQNLAFKLNKGVGSVVENNARIAHYLSKVADGLSPEKAAESVKKFLFDYGDLTSFEKNIMKRLAPFYTWTRKNLPIQLEGLFTQPAKYVLPHKIVQKLEAGVEVPNEKYMSQYIGENIPVRIRKNEEGNTEYFLLGNWLPYAQSLDILSNPLDNIVAMTSPFIKTPYEQLSNQSTFFKDTLGQPSPIERDYKQQGEFLGQVLRQKNIQLLKNIRILNDINKWIDKQDPTATKDTWVVKILNTLFGKTATYDVGKSKYFYDLDTEERKQDYKKAIKSAQKKGDAEKANQLIQELNEFLEIRR